MVWIAGAGTLLLVIITVAALVSVFGYRDHMKTSQLVTWTIFILVVPVVGVLSYVLWRISRSGSMEESMEFQHEYPIESDKRPPIQQG